MPRPIARCTLDFRVTFRVSLRWTVVVSRSGGRCWYVCLVGVFVHETVQMCWCSCWVFGFVRGCSSQTPCADLVCALLRRSLKCTRTSRQRTLQGACVHSRGSVLAVLHLLSGETNEGVELSQIHGLLLYGFECASQIVGEKFEQDRVPGCTHIWPYGSTYLLRR